MMELTSFVKFNKQAVRLQSMELKKLHATFNEK